MLGLLTYIMLNMCLKFVFKVKLNKFDCFCNCSITDELRIRWTNFGKCLQVEGLTCLWLSDYSQMCDVLDLYFQSHTVRISLFFPLLQNDIRSSNFGQITDVLDLHFLRQTFCCFIAIKRNSQAIILAYLCTLTKDRM